MRILHIASDDLWGGAEAQIDVLISSFNKHKSEAKISLLTFNNGILSKKISEQGSSEILISDESNGLVRLIIDAICFAKATKSNIIVSHGYKEAILAAMLSICLGISWIHQIHGTSENYTGVKWLKSKLVKFTEKFLYRLFSKKIICVSNETLRKSGLENSLNATVILNSTKVKGNLTTNHKAKSSFKIYMIGRLVPVKRIDIAIKTISKLIAQRETKHDLELHLVGDGPELKKLKKLAENLNLSYSNIIFHGFLKDSEDLIYNDADLLLLTSDSEGIPTVILEAMRYRIPIISRSVGGIPEIKSAANTYPLILVNDNQMDDLDIIILDVINNINILRESANSSDLSFFEPERLVSQHYQVYKACL